MSDEALQLDPGRCALIIQDMQNDVMMEGGAFADSGAPAHAKEQNAVENWTTVRSACISIPSARSHAIRTTAPW